jgi:mono/diheme cytochrome c family protein
MINRLLVLVLVLAGAAMLSAAGCGGPSRTGAPLTEPLLLSDIDSPVARGQRAFMNHCHQCHPGGSAGLAPSLTGTIFPDALVRFQVRNGLGAMPSFNKAQLSDDELDGIVRYLNALRRL